MGGSEVLTDTFEQSESVEDDLDIWGAAGTNLDPGSSWLEDSVLLRPVAGVVTGVTESETSEPETSDTGEKGKLEPGLRILRDLINKSEIG